MCLAPPPPLPLGCLHIYTKMNTSSSNYSSSKALYKCLNHSLCMFQLALCTAALLPELKPAPAVSQNQECKEQTCVLGKTALASCSWKNELTRWRAHRTLLTVWDDVFLLGLRNSNVTPTQNTSTDKKAYWETALVSWINQVWPIIADRKQGAGSSSGSSAAVHKANYLSCNWHFSVLGLTLIMSLWILIVLVVDL